MKFNLRLFFGIIGLLFSFTIPIIGLVFSLLGIFYKGKRKLSELIIGFAGLSISLAFMAVNYLIMFGGI